MVARRLYPPLLESAFHHKFVVLLAAGGLLAVSVPTYLALGQEFIPSLDEFDIAAEINKITSASGEQSTRMQHVIEHMLLTLPQVAFVVSKTGTAELATDPMPPSSSDVYIILKPRAEWPHPEEPKASVLSRIQAMVDRIPGTTKEFSQPIALRFNELIAGVKSDFAIKIFGDDLATLRDLADQIAVVMGGVRGAVDVKVEQTTGQPVVTLRPNWDALAHYGITPSEIHETLTAAIRGRVIGQIWKGTLHYPIVLRFPEAILSEPQRARTAAGSAPGICGRVPAGAQCPSRARNVSDQTLRGSLGCGSLGAGGCRRPDQP